MSLLNHGLEAFLAIIRQGTVHGAAREIGLSQTGVTQRIRALERDLAQLPLAEATRELAEGRVVDPRGRPVRWEPALQVGPITPRAKRWFESDDYLRTSSQVRDECRFGRG